MSRAAQRRPRVRMSAHERREQLIDVGRGLFAARGLDGTSVEEIAASADVSKPVVYEHFGGKEGLYAVVVDREVRTLLEAIRAALATPDVGPRRTIEVTAMALLDYIDAHADGFRILAKGSPAGAGSGSFSSLLSDIASQVEDQLALAFKERGYPAKDAPVYAQALVGLVALTGLWWLEERTPSKEAVAAHLVNLAWNGLSHLEKPTRRKR